MSKKIFRLTTLLMLLVIIFSVAVAPGIAAGNERREPNEPNMPKAFYVTQTVPNLAGTADYCYNILYIWYNDLGNYVMTTSYPVGHNLNSSNKCTTKLIMPKWNCTYKK